MRDRPSGTVTFVFTDVESSTRLLRELGEKRMPMCSLHIDALSVSGLEPVLLA